MDIMLDRILELVGSKHGSKKELADAIGFPPNLIAEWKSGRNKSYPKYATQIAAFYGVSLDWLTGLSDEKEKSAPISEGRLAEDMKFLLSMYHSVPVEKRAEALAKIASDLKNAGLID